MNKGFLVSLILPHHDVADIKEECEEIHLLAKTIDYKIIETFTQKSSKINPSTYIGKGKIREIISKAEELNIRSLFINDELKPSQLKNIKNLSDGKINIIDRTYLILNIFKKNAKTKESKAQVKLATLEYLMPRLTGMWTHLERQMGGVGTRGGPGEKQIEIDRRIVRNEVKKLKIILTSIRKQRINQTKQRRDLFKVSLVGYTNAGKSSIFNCITGYNTLVKNQLFATLETTTKKVVLPNKKNILLSDTVGFLRRLPHNLVASFRSTLREINDSDLIIKVIDISSNDINSHINTINNTLKDLNAEKCKSLYVFNKIDLVKDENIFITINNKYNKPIMISAFKDLRMEDLYSKINEITLFGNDEFFLNIPQEESFYISYVYDNAVVLKRDDEYDYIKFKISCSKNNYAKIVKKIKGII